MELTVRIYLKDGGLRLILIHWMLPLIGIMKCNTITM